MREGANPRPIDLLGPIWREAGLREECRHVDVGFEPDAHGERRYRLFHTREQWMRAAEVIEHPNAAARPADPLHLE